MSEIVIEKNVQAPPLREKREYKKVLDKMDVGHSFLAPLIDRQHMSALIRQEFHRVGNKRFTTSNRDQPEGMFRIWRLADEVKQLTA